MRFKTEAERKIHPQAGLIPDALWEKYFTNNKIDDVLLNIVSESMNNVSDDNVLGLVEPAKSRLILDLDPYGDFKILVILIFCCPRLNGDQLLKVVDHFKWKTPHFLLEMLVIYSKQVIFWRCAYEQLSRLSLGSTSKQEDKRVLSKEDLLYIVLDKSDDAVFIDALHYAAKHNCLRVFKLINAKAPNLYKTMQIKDKTEVLRNAAINCHRDVFKYLKRIDLPNVFQDIIRNDGDRIFETAASNGNLDVLQYLEEEMRPILLQDAISKKHIALNMFYFAACNGHLDVLKYLESKTPNLLHKMIKYYNYSAFRGAAENGHVNVLSYLEEKTPNSFEMIKAVSDSPSVQRIASNGHANSLIFLMRYVVGRRSIINCVNRDYYLADIVFYKSSDADIIELLKHPDIFERTCSHNADKIKPFIAEQMKELKARQAHGNPPRLLHNQQEAQCLFYLLYHLINREGIEAKDNILFLLKIPELQALLPKARRPYNTTNVALREAISKRRSAQVYGFVLEYEIGRWDDIIQAFYLIPEVRAQAERDGHYRREAQGQLDLRAIANNRESSMRAATQEELEQLKKLKDYYQPKIQELKNTGGTEWVLGAATGLISEYYSNNKTIFTNTKGKEIKLPLLWDDFQKLNLTGKDRELALKAYYTSQVHSAYRLFLKPNPWIANNAGHTEALEGGRAACFAGYEETMAVLILAAFDKEVDKTYSTCNKAEDSSAKNIDSQQLDFQRGASESRLGLGPTNTPDERISLLCLTLSDITRAHNWDKSRQKTDATGNVVFEQYDDLEADKPSCIYGVSTRLMQSIAGHPLFIPIDVIAEESVREYLQNMINSKLNYFTPAFLQELYTYGQNIAQANAVDERTAQQFQLIFTQDNYNALMNQVLNKYQRLLQEKGESEENLKHAVNERLLELGLIDLSGNSTVDEPCFGDAVLESSCTDVYTTVLRSASSRNSSSAASLRRGLINQQEKSTNKNLWIDVSDYFNYTQEQIKRIAGERKVVLKSIDVNPDEPTSKPGVLEGTKLIIKPYLERAKEVSRVSQESMLPFIQAKNEAELKAAWKEWTPKTNNEKVLAEDLKRNYPEFFDPKPTKCSYDNLSNWYIELKDEEFYRNALINLENACRLYLTKGRDDNPHKHKRDMVKKIINCTEGKIKNIALVKELIKTFSESNIISILSENIQSKSELILKVLAAISIVFGIALAIKRGLDTNGKSINFFKPLAKVSVVEPINVLQVGIYQ